DLLSESTAPTVAISSSFSRWRSSQSASRLLMTPSSTLIVVSFSSTSLRRLSSSAASSFIWRRISIVSIAIISVPLLFSMSCRHPRVARVSCINRKFHVNPTGKSLNARRHEVHQVAPSRLPTILRYRKQQGIVDAGLYKSQHRIRHSQQGVTDNLTCP